MSIPIYDHDRKVSGTFRSLMHIMLSAPRTDQNLEAFQKLCAKAFRPLSESDVQTPQDFKKSVKTRHFGMEGPVSLTTAFEGVISVSMRKTTFVQIRFRAQVHGLWWFSAKPGVARLLDDVSDIVPEVYGEPLPPFSEAIGGGFVTGISDGVIDCYVSKWLAPKRPGMVVVSLGNREVWDNGNW